MAKRIFKPVDGGINTDPIGDEITPGTDTSGGSGGSGGVSLNPAELGNVPGTGAIDGTEGTGKQKRKRGPNKSKREALDLGTVKNTLIFAHFGLAGAFNAPELALTQEQADVYAAAASDVLSYYDTGATAKTIAWVNLLSAMGGIYYNKITQISSRKAVERAQKVREQAVQNSVPRAAMGVV